MAELTSHRLLGALLCSASGVMISSLKPCKHSWAPHCSHCRSHSSKRGAGDHSQAAEHLLCRRWGCLHASLFLPTDVHHCYPQRQCTSKAQLTWECVYLLSCLSMHEGKSVHLQKNPPHITASASGWGGLVGISKGLSWESIFFLHKLSSCMSFWLLITHKARLC